MTRTSLLYVSTALEIWAPTIPHPDQDMICERHGFRRLNPEYYAWLRLRMEIAKRARINGRLSATQYDRLRQRFNDMHLWAVERWGVDELLAAVQSLDPKTYCPPVVVPYTPWPSRAS